ncbi:exonuclease SbcCD subunit D [Paenibacillus sp. UMB4589-SE434]|uniref:exonuclease SbcCD subunit D n=1 Tax=Paenibacillus sp. UMB4589-SE434 TaxID=3046314 RepID=UPI00254BC7A3|nr:exonuclease SbcCD subunit D [Paenibacillus sp. UMB4589-SE434]MDK8181001.1 exonuclease SbcCD subunit D [Paenibacillus sp. UMB4589-SE434]
MRILHTADWHFGRTLEGRSRLEEQAAFVDELVDLADEEGIDLILLAGDVYDSVNPPAAAELLFYEAIERLSKRGTRPIVIISGNHDHPERLAASAPLLRHQGIFIVGQPTEQPVFVPIERTDEQAVIAALSYPSESRLKQLLSVDNDEESIRTAYSARVGQLLAKQAQAYRNDSVNLMMSHLYVLGGKESESERPIQVGGAYTVDPSAFDVCSESGSRAQYTALGHLHRPQRVKGPGVIRYSGSPIGYSFSEAGQTKSVTIVEISPGTTAAEPVEHYLSAGRPLASWQVKGGYGELCTWLDEGRDRNAWLDVNLHLQEALTMEQIQHIRKAHAGIVHIRPVYPEMQEIQAEAGRRSDLPVQELFRRFYERQTGGAVPDDALIKLFLELVGEREHAEEVDA